MEEEQIEQGKKITKLIVLVLYISAILIPLIIRIKKLGEIDSIGIILVILLFIPILLSAIIKLIKMLSNKRTEIDVVSDHKGFGTLLGALTSKAVVFGVGILTVMVILVMYVPAPWNLFIILAGAYLIFASVHLL